MGFRGKGASQSKDDKNENAEGLAYLKDIVGDRSAAFYMVKRWDACRKRISNLVNHVTADNIEVVLAELLVDNMYDGAGLFTSSCLKAQMVAAPELTPVFADLVFQLEETVDDIGLLVLNRLLMHWRRAFKRNDKPVLLKATKFLAHLLNQRVAKETLALEIVTWLLAEPTEDRVECAVEFVKDVGRLLLVLLPRELKGVFETFLEIMYEGGIDNRVRTMIEDLFAIRKARFQDFPSKIPEMGERKIHEVSLGDELKIGESGAHVFGRHPSFMEDESIKHENLDDTPNDVDLEFGDYCFTDEEEDRLETSLMRLRRAICVTLSKCDAIEKSGQTFDSRHHNVLNIKVQPGQELVLWLILVECCSREEIYSSHYARIAESLCWTDRPVYQRMYERSFSLQVALISRLDNNKIRNMAKFYGHLVGKGSISWEKCLSPANLPDEATDQSSRLFIDILFHEATELIRLDAKKLISQQQHSRQIYIDRNMPCIIQNRHEHVKVEQHVVQPESESEVEDMEYEVEAILKSKMTRKGKQFLVKWKGYEVDKASWEPAETLKNASEAVRDYETAKRRRQSPRG